MNLILELDEVEYTVLDKSEFGKNASYHVGANTLKYLSDWLEESSKNEVLYSLSDWNDHIAIVFTRDQLSIVAQASELDGIDIPRIREK